MHDSLVIIGIDLAARGLPADLYLCWKIPRRRLEGRRQRQAETLEYIRNDPICCIMLKGGRSVAGFMDSE